MISFRDMTFCTRPERVCTCPAERRITDDVLAAAEKWWGGPDFPICVGPVCGHEEKCEGSHCKDNPAQEPHTCPYAEEINDDSESLCNCCAVCADECAMDI